MPGHALPRPRFLTVTVAVLVLVGCSASVPGADADPGGSSTTPGAADRSATAATIDWQDCDAGLDDFDCATLQVPLDHADPDGATLELALTRLPASGSDPVGPLLVNPGGPGGSGIDFVQGNLWPAALTRNFDLIGFDPRGVGRSTPLDCGFDIGELYAPDPAPRTAGARTELLTVSEDYVSACTDAGGEMLEHMGTRAVAADMDAIRAALGVDQLNYLGYSYGTSIGQVYADAYPDRVRAMVLDGVVELGQPGLAAAQDQGTAFDEVFESFFDWCGSNAGCPDDPEAAFLEIRDRLREEPMPTDEADRDLTSGAFHLGVGQALYVSAYWPTLASALSEGLDGDGSLLQDLADQYLGRQPDGSYGNQADVYFAVSCLDWDWPSNPEAFFDAGREIAETSPFLAEAIVTDYIRCAFWPTPPQPLEPPTAEGSPPIVVVSTTGDPATPYANGVELAERLPQGRLISVTGDDHTAFGRGNACVDDAVTAYLVSLRPPAPALAC